MHIVKTARAASRKRIQGASVLQHQLRGTSHAKKIIKKHDSNLKIHTQWLPIAKRKHRLKTRNDFLLITTHPNHNSLPKQNKTIQIHVWTTHWCPRVIVVAEVFSLHPDFSWHFQNCHRYILSIDCIAPTGRREPPSKEVPKQEGQRGALDHPPWGAVLRFGGRPFPDVGLRGSPHPTNCEDCHRDRRHQSRLVTGPPGGPMGPTWDGGPARGLIKLEINSLVESGLCRHQWCTQGAGWAVP